MKIEIEIPDYTDVQVWGYRNGLYLAGGMEFTWDANSELGTKIEDDAFSIIANEAGLLSMANHCLNMAQESLDVYDLPFDVGCELEEGSEYFVLVKTPTPEKYLE